MSRTWHHNEKRFHPWKNPTCSAKGFEAFLDDYARRWGHRQRTRFYFVDYDKSPSWWVRIMMGRPLRRKVRGLEIKLRGAKEYDAVIWPHCRRPHLCYW